MTIQQIGKMAKRNKKELLKYKQYKVRNIGWLRKKEYSQIVLCVE